MKYRKKPVVVEAMQWTGDNEFELDQFVDVVVAFNYPEMEMIIPTLEGDHTASVGDWIIKGVAGEFYPCKPDIFEMTYEAVTL